MAGRGAGPAPAPADGRGGRQRRPIRTSPRPGAGVPASGCRHPASPNALPS